MNYLIVAPRIYNDKHTSCEHLVGIAYVSASLKSIKDSVFTLNLNGVQDIYSKLKDAIQNNVIDCIAVGGTSLQYNIVNEIITYSKKINPKIIAIIGGGLVTASPFVAMKGIPDADIGIIGEGEYIIKELSNALETNKDLNSVNGIIFRKANKELALTNSRGDIENLDELPFPDFEGFIDSSTDMSMYSISTSRSCPYSCTFCFHTCGKKYRTRSLDNVFAEIDSVTSKYKIKFLNINDELFVSSKKRALEFCERIKKYNISWGAQSRADTADMEIFKSMHDSGCVTLSVGIESANNDILKGMKKNITIQQIEAALELISKANIKPFGNFLLGDKNETFDSFSKTIEWFKHHPQYEFGFNRIVVLPGSQLYNYALESGYIKDELKYWKDGFPYINITQMTNEEYQTSFFNYEHIRDEIIYLPSSYKLLNINFEQSNAEVEIICKNCTNEFKIVTSDFAWRATDSYTCPKCRQHFHAPLYNLLKYSIDKALKEYLKHNRIYIYGVGVVTKRFVFLCDLMQNENVVLIDSDQCKQKNLIYGKTIFGPDILEKEQVETVLISTQNKLIRSEISDLLIKRYKSVKYITNLYDFIFSLIQNSMG